MKRPGDIQRHDALRARSLWRFRDASATPSGVPEITTCPPPLKLAAWTMPAPVCFGLGAGGGTSGAGQAQHGRHRARRRESRPDASPARAARPDADPSQTIKRAGGHQRGVFADRMPGDRLRRRRTGFLQGAQGGDRGHIQRGLRVDRLPQRLFRAVKAERADLGAE